tara:strand:+ start:13 stop:225 length:213 start_codon:yes stop_codon:yes gene_type:complete
VKKLIRLLVNKLRKQPKKNKIVQKFTISDKNPWLYPTDNFGKLEKGVVHDNKYLRNKKYKREQKFLLFGN